MIFRLYFKVIVIWQWLWNCHLTISFVIWNCHLSFVVCHLSFEIVIWNCHLTLSFDNDFSKSFDNDFEIESKYHRKICCLVVLAHILSSQDVVFRSMFFPIFHYNVVTVFMLYSSTPAVKYHVVERGRFCHIQIIPSCKNWKKKHFSSISTVTAWTHFYVAIWNNYSTCWITKRFMTSQDD